MTPTDNCNQLFTFILYLAGLKRPRHQSCANASREVISRVSSLSSLRERFRMRNNRLFWVSVFGPLSLFTLGLFLPWEGRNWVLYDTFFLFWLSVSLLSLHFWRRAFRNSSRRKMMYMFFLSALNIMTASLGLLYDYFAYDDLYRGHPWVMANLGLRRAQYSMGLAEALSAEQIRNNSDLPIPERLHGYLLGMAKAEHWWRMSAASGCIAAQYAMYGYAKVLSSDKVWPMEDIQWLQAAANQGYYPSQHQLADLYNKGTSGLPQDKARAAYWYNKSTEHSGRPLESTYVPVPRSCSINN